MRQAETIRIIVRQRETRWDKLVQNRISKRPRISNVYDRNTYIDIDFRFMFRYNR